MVVVAAVVVVTGAEVEADTVVVTVTVEVGTTPPGWGMTPAQRGVEAPRAALQICWATKDTSTLAEVPAAL